MKPSTLNQTGMTQRVSSLKKDCSSAVWRPWLSSALGPWLCVVRFPWFCLSEAGRSWSQLIMILDALAVRRRLLAVLLLSAVWQPWFSPTLGPWLCVAGLSPVLPFIGAYLLLHFH